MLRRMTTITMMVATEEYVNGNELNTPESIVKYRKVSLKVLQQVLLRVR